ncbi:MAG: hypothetical protein WBN94_00235 [Methanothrix sp.]
MSGVPFSLFSVMGRCIQDLIRTKFDSHDMGIFFREAMRLIESDNFDLAFGYINAAIDRSASDEDKLNLYLLKCEALLGQLVTATGDSINDNRSQMLTPGVVQSERALLIREKIFDVVDATLAINPRFYLAHYFRGLAYLATLDFRNFLRALDDALTLEPDEGIKLQILDFQAKLYSVATLDCYDPQKAINCCEKILQIDSTNEDALFLLRLLRGDQ